MTGADRSRRGGAPGDRRGTSARTRPRRDVPLYARVLRLRHIAPSGFLCFVYLEGAVALGILLGLAELVSWWDVLVLPAVVALMVKLNDVVAGLLARPAGPGGRAGEWRAGTPGSAPGQDSASTPHPVVGRANPGTPAGVLHGILEAEPPMSRPWTDQMARQSAARRYE